VGDVFMVSGGGTMHLTDAIVKHKKMNYICSQNEQATSMEAEGYSRANENFGVAIVSSGPAATNAITGVVGAWMDSTPCMVISGQSKISQTIYKSGIKKLRQFGSQEINIVPMIDAVTKYSCVIDDPNKIKYHLEKAVYYSKEGRPGPVWLDIPLDIQGALIDPGKLKGFSGKEIKEKIRISKQNLGSLFKLLKKSKRPVMVAGNGIKLSKAQKEFIKFVEFLNIPVVTPRLGIGLMETDHKLHIGRIGNKGDRPGNLAIQNADLLLCVGTRLSINATGHDYKNFAKNAKIVVVDIDKYEHEKHTIAVDKFIHCDAGVFLSSLLNLLRQNKFKYSDTWLKICRNWKKKYPVVLPSYKNQKVINTYYFTDVLSKNLNSDDVIVIDSGSSSYVVSQAIKIKKGQKFIASGGLGSMGYALPASIGASAARGKKRVICITGDGSLHFNAQELQTAAHNRLPIKIFIFNNNSYSSIYNTQHNFFGSRYIGVDKNSGVSLPNILKTGELYGVKGMSIKKNNDIEKKIKEALAYDGPVICDVVCDKKQLIIPTVHSVKNKDGTFTSRPLEDMFPFLSREELQSNMINDN
jgi:acetolactate synthase-1/2/3 large subunit